MRPLERAHKFCCDDGLEIPILMAPMKQLGIKWFATVTSVSEALKAKEACADARWLCKVQRQAVTEVIFSQTMITLQD